MNKKILLFLLILISFCSFKIVFAEEQSQSIDSILNSSVEEISDDKNTNISIENSAEIPTIGAIEDTKQSQYSLVIEDDAHLLSDEEIERLKDKMTSLLEYGNIIFKTIQNNSTSASSYAEQYYHQNFQTESGTLFLIDMDNRKIYIFSDGQNYRYITNSKASSITDNTYQYATRKEYYECAYHTFDQILTVLEGRKIAEPMRYTSIFVISLVLSFFINFLIILSKSRIKSSDNNEIVKGCNIDFNLGDVHAEKTGTHRVYSPVSDSSSSGGGSSGGGGGGGGGGSSGGGGGHSF